MKVKVFSESETFQQSLLTDTRRLALLDNHLSLCPSLIWSNMYSCIIISEPLLLSTSCLTSLLFRLQLFKLTFQNNLITTTIMILILCLPAFYFPTLHFNNNNNNTINIWSDQPQNSPNLFIQTFQHTLTVDDMPMGLIGFTIRAGKPSWKKW